MPFDPLKLHRFSTRLFDRSPPAAALATVLAMALVFATAEPAAARGPENIADVAEQVIDAVVNISTSQKIDPRVTELPDMPPGSPMEEFFDQFFKNRRGNGGNDQTPRRVNSLGSGFIIDASGLVVTNNHVIADADEINVILNDGTKLKATLVGKDTKSDLALLRVRSDKPVKAVKFGDSDKLRLGEWVIAIGNPFSLGGSVTAGIEPGDVVGDLLDAHAKPAAARFAELAKLIDHRDRAVGRHGETDADRAARRRNDRGVDADHLAIEIEQRPA